MKCIVLEYMYIKIGFILDGENTYLSYYTKVCHGYADDVVIGGSILYWEIPVGFTL